MAKKYKIPEGDPKEWTFYQTKKLIKEKTGKELKFEGEQGALADCIRLMVLLSWLGFTFTLNANKGGGFTFHVAGGMNPDGGIFYWQATEDKLTNAILLGSVRALKDFG